MSIVIHNVNILDKSGSMLGAKYDAAVKGINIEMEALKKDENASYTQTIIEFSGIAPSFMTEHCFMIPLANVKNFVGAGASGGTPLYQTVGEVIEKLVKYVNPGEKVLLKIFTDGEENTSMGKYANSAELKKLINTVTELNGFIVTFEGTKFDGEKVAREVGINVNNMYFHNNDEFSIQASSLARSRSTINYTANLSRGVDTSKNFYAEEKKDGI